MANNPNSPRLDIDRALWPAVGALLAVFGLFEVTTLDLRVQDWFFDFERGRWLIDRDTPLWRALFYTGPKILIGAVALVLAGSIFLRRFRTRRRDFVAALLSLVSVPVLVGLGKDATNVFCPWDITRYGGDVAYVRVLEHFPEDARPERRGRGFPAGHASGGFALVALAGLARTRRMQRIGIAVGLALGSLMGVYQMAKGAHYLSHTLVTAFVAWTVFLVWRRVVRAAVSPAGACGVRRVTSRDRLAAEAAQFAPEYPEAQR